MNPSLGRLRETAIADYKSLFRLILSHFPYFISLLSGVIVAYFLLHRFAIDTKQYPKVEEWEWPFRLGAAMLLFGIYVLFLYAAVSKRDRAMKIAALGFLPILLSLAIYMFAAIYCRLGLIDTHTYKPVLDHETALYFSVTTLTTVGYGDIIPSLASR